MTTVCCVVAHLHDTLRWMSQETSNVACMFRSFKQPSYEIGTNQANAEQSREAARR
jgi:hypothetical protein